MVLFGQWVIGPPGAGKSTFCDAMQQMCVAAGRTQPLVVNLDMGNEGYAYDCAWDVRDEVIRLEDAMDELTLGPNGGLVYCVENLRENLDVLITYLTCKVAQNEKAMREGKASGPLYVIFDTPGQVELYTHYGVMTQIVRRLQHEADARLTGVHLMESTLCLDTPRYIGGVLCSLSAMMQLELPHVNVLSKTDVLARLVSADEAMRAAAVKAGKLRADEDGQLPPSSLLDLFPLSYFCHAQGLAHLIRTMDGDIAAGLPGDSARPLMGMTPAGAEADGTPAGDSEQRELRRMRANHPMQKKFRRFNAGLAECIEEMGLVKLYPVAVQSKSAMLRALAQIDLSNGLAMAGQGGSLYDMALRHEDDEFEWDEFLIDSKEAAEAAADAM